MKIIFRKLQRKSRLGSIETAFVYILKFDLL